MRLCAHLGLMLGFLLPLSTMAQSPSADPAAVARDFYAAIERRDWSAAAAVVDPALVLRHREIELAGLVWWAAHREELRKSMLQAYAESSSGGFAVSMDGQIELRLDSAALAAHGSLPLRVYPGAPTLAEVARWSPQEFMTQTIAAVEEQPFPGVHRPSPRPRRTVIGAVVENDSTAYVLYRSEELRAGEWSRTRGSASGLAAGNDEDPAPEVLRLSRQADRWYVRPRAEVLAAPRSYLFWELDVEVEREKDAHDDTSSQPRAEPDEYMPPAG